MAKKIGKSSKKADKKRRTRGHIIADHSLVHVQYFIVNAGFTSEAVTKDYGYDLTVNTFDREGLIEPGAIMIQLKASEILKTHSDGMHFVFQLDVRDYNLWLDEPNPAFLILYEASSRKAYWIYLQKYLKGDSSPKPKPNARSIRVKVPMANKVRTNFLRHARRLKDDVLRKILGANPHV